MCGNPSRWQYLVRKKIWKKNINFSWRKSIFKNFEIEKFWDFFLSKKINFRNIEIFNEQIFSGNFSKKSIFRKFFRKIFFHWKFRCSEKLFFWRKKSRFFFDFKILKIDFRHEKLIFFFQIFFPHKICSSSWIPAHLELLKTK